MTREVQGLWITEPGVLEWRKRPLKDRGPKDVLIRVRAYAICGSDMHIYKGEHPAASTPIAIGHEFSGEVVEIGSGVMKVRRGDRVVVEPLITCGECYYCLKGEYNRCVKISVNYRSGYSGFTEYFVASERWTHVIPD
ncbi:MAG: alcohol dehydrogenase catalytic domain-containing protein, partial [Candidatus Binatia bacterium]